MKLRDEIEYLMGQAPEPLGTFLEMMMHSYQIENVISFIYSAVEERKGGSNKAPQSSHNPLGQFEGMKSVQALIKDFGDSEVDLGSIFSSILIDLPVG